MNKKVTIELSEAAILSAEKRAAQEGFASLDDYLDALIRDDSDIDLDQDWIRKRIEEGIASGASGPFGAGEVQRLVSDGIARAKRGT